MSDLNAHRPDWGTMNLDNDLRAAHAQIEQLTGERDRARATAVRFEQQLAIADVLIEAERLGALVELARLDEELRAAKRKSEVLAKSFRWCNYPQDGDHSACSH